MYNYVSLPLCKANMAVNMLDIIWLLCLSDIDSLATHQLIKKAVIYGFGGQRWIL